MQLYKFPFVGIFGGLFVLGFDLALLYFVFVSKNWHHCHSETPS